LVFRFAELLLLWYAQYETCLVTLLHYVKVVTLWFYVVHFLHYVKHSGDMIFSLFMLNYCFSFSQYETCLVTLLHYVKVVTLWLKSSTFALCTSGDVIFVFSLYVELVLLLYNHAFTLCKSCHTVALVIHFYVM
jgi:hypothetical protein